MRPSDLILAVKNKEGETVSLVPIGKDTRIIFCGASVPASVIPSDKWLSSLTLAPKTGQKGIVAVHVYYHAGKSAWTAEFLLSVKNENGEASVDLENLWFPVSERLGQAAGVNAVEVIINNEIYTSDSTYRKEGKHFIPNPLGGNLLCQYLTGDVPAQAVIDAAQDAVRETDALAKAAELRKEMKETKDKYSVLLKHIARLEEKLLTCLGTFDAVEKETNSICRGWMWWNTTGKILKNFREKYKEL